MSHRTFGLAPDGSAVSAVDIKGEELSATILSLGAILQSLRVKDRDVVSGFSRAEDYVHGPYFGAVAGRCGNRIAAGTFELDGETFQVTKNERGVSHLHGGKVGTAQRNWTVKAYSESEVTLGLVLADGEEGYPGKANLEVTYSIEGAALKIALSGTTTKPTLLNLATHSYFNLDGSETILDHKLMIPAAAWCPVDSDLIPTGELALTAGSHFDFRDLRPVKWDGAGYDHNYALYSAPSADVRLCARLEGATSGIAMEIWSTEPGVQFYDAKGAGAPIPTADGRKIGDHFALCLEPQRFPDAIHHRHFPGSVLRPGETYVQKTEYRFSAV